MAEQTDSAHERVFALESATTLAPLAVMRLLSRYERRQLASFIAVAIDLLDAVDGDPDIEANGDELDGTASEDDYLASLCDTVRGPGCVISDFDSAVDDRPCDDDELDLDEGCFDSGQPINGGGSGDY